MTFLQITNTDWFEADVNFCNPELRDKLDGGTHYEICFMSGDWFIYRLPFRRYLNLLISTISKEFGAFELVIDEYLEHEDFVGFKLRGTHTDIDGYYEHSLGYISLYFKDCEFAQSVADILNLGHYCIKAYECEEVFDEKERGSRGL